MIWPVAFIIIALIAALFGLAWLGSKYPRPKGGTVRQTFIEAQPICLTNVHAFETINIQAGPELSGGVKSTLAIKRCVFCSLHVTPLHQGEWTLEDFTRKESSAAILNGWYAPKGELR